MQPIMQNDGRDGIPASGASGNKSRPQVNAENERVRRETVILRDETQIRNFWVAVEVRPCWRLQTPERDDHESRT